MSIIKWSLIAAAVLALGFAVCPAVPSGRRVDPEELLHRALSTDTNHQSRISLIRRNYTPLVEGEDRIAGRPVWTLRLKPSRKQFPWKQLWIDKQTGAVLASRDWTGRNQIRDSKGASATLYNPIQLAGDKLDKGAPALRGSRSGRAALPNASRVLGREVPIPRYVPACFELASVEVDKTDGDVQLVYSDGLYVFSLFVGPGVGRAARTMSPNRPYDWGDGLALLTRSKETSVLIVADMPVEEIQKVAGSIH